MTQLVLIQGRAAMEHAISQIINNLQFQSVLISLGVMRILGSLCRWPRSLLLKDLSPYGPSAQSFSLPFLFWQTPPYPLGLTVDITSSQKPTLIAPRLDFLSTPWYLQCSTYCPSEWWLPPPDWELLEGWIGCLDKTRVRGSRLGRLRTQPPDPDA